MASSSTDMLWILGERKGSARKARGNITGLEVHQSTSASPIVLGKGKQHPRAAFIRLVITATRSHWGWSNEVPFRIGGALRARILTSNHASIAGRGERECSAAQVEDIGNELPVRRGTSPSLCSCPCPRPLPQRLHSRRSGSIRSLPCRWLRGERKTEIALWEGLGSPRKEKRRHIRVLCCGKRAVRVLLRVAA